MSHTISAAAHAHADAITAGIHRAARGERSDLFADSVLTDLIGDAWFQSQQDVIANYGASYADVTVVGLSFEQKRARATIAEVESRRTRRAFDARPLTA